MASIIEHTLTTIKETNPSMQEAFLRSDKAGYCHCAYLILSLPSLGDRAGMKIARYDFSDPQAGKDVCDRRIATVKSHMRRYINEGHDIRSAADMKAAIDSYGGVKGCQAAVVNVQEHNQTMKKHKMSGIQALNNFIFESEGLRVWKAYNVGPGKLFSSVQVKGFGTPQEPTDLCALFSPSAFHVCKLVLSGQQRGMLCSNKRILALHSRRLSKTSHQLVKPRKCISPALRMDVQKLTNLMVIYKNTWPWIQESTLFAWREKATYNTIKKKWADKCAEI